MLKSAPSSTNACHPLPTALTCDCLEFFPSSTSLRTLCRWVAGLLWFGLLFLRFIWHFCRVTAFARLDNIWCGAFTIRWPKITEWGGFAKNGLVKSCIGRSWAYVYFCLAFEWLLRDFLFRTAPFGTMLAHCSHFLHRTIAHSWRWIVSQIRRGVVLLSSLKHPLRGIFL